MPRHQTYLIHACLMICFMASSVIADSIYPLAFGSGASILILCLGRRSARQEVLTVPNLVTLSRLLMMLIAITVLMDRSGYLALCVLILALIMDGLDGFLARRLNAATKLGADLDLESDAVFVALMSVLWWVDGLLPWWILVSGGARYLFVLVLNLTGYGQTQSPPMKWAREIAVIHFIALLLPFVIGSNMFVPALGISSGLIIFSFVREYILRVRSA